MRTQNNTNIYYILTVFFVTVLAGCATGPLPEAYTSGIKTVVSIPQINTQASAEIGQTIISKANVTKIPAINFTNDASEVVNYPGTTTIRARTIPLYASDERGKFYRDYLATFSMMGSSIVYDNAGIFVPNEKTKPAVVYHFALGYKFGKIPVLGVEDSTFEKWGKDSFKRELVYSGVAQNTISILYREFSDNIARPAFSQELKYDLAQGNIIGFKGARFEVIKATNTELVYKVVKPLD